MGKPIVYCVNCGRSVREDDFLRRQAWMVDHRPWCATCKPLPPEAPAPRSSSRPVPILPATPRRPIPAARARSKAPLLLGAVLAAAPVALLAALLRSGSPAPAPAAESPRPILRVPPPPERSKAVEDAARAPLEPAAPAGDATDRYVAMIRELWARDLNFRKRGEAKNLIEATRRQAGARAGEIDRLEADYDRAFQDAARKAADAAAVDARALAAKGRGAEALARLDEVPPAFAETDPVRKLSALREELLREPAPAANAEPAGSPSIVLRATGAKIKDLALKRDEYLGNWHTDGGAAEWMAAPPAGRWKVEVVYAADPAAGGSLVVTLGAAQLEWDVLSTGDFKTYRTVPLGTVELPGGALTVRARGKGTHKEGLLNLRELRLTPLP